MMSSVSYVHIGSLEMKAGQKKDSRFSIVQLIGLGWGDIVKLYEKSGHFPVNIYERIDETGAGKAIDPGLVDEQPEKDHRTTRNGSTGEWPEITHYRTDRFSQCR